MSPGKKSPGKKSPVKKSPGKKSPGKKYPGKKYPGKKSPPTKKPPKPSANKSPKKSPKKSPDSETLTFRPKIFDNDVIDAEKRWLPRDAFDTVVNWYRKHTQKLYKKYVHITGATFPNIKMWVSPEFVVKYPGYWQDLLMDPDDDGNYPIMYENREYLVSGPDRE